MYFRDISSSDSQSFTVATGVFRAAYVLKFGNLAVVPLDFYVPVENITFYTPAGVAHASRTSRSGRFLRRSQSQTSSAVRTIPP